MSNLDARMGLSTANLINGMHKMIGFFFLGLILLSCGKKEKASTILDPHEMASIMVDVYLAEARLNGSLMKRDSAKQIFKPFEMNMLSKKGVADSVLKKSYLYYLDHPGELEEIYAEVIDTLALREQRAKVKPNP
jgi:hypothetical protein